MKSHEFIFAIRDRSKTKGVIRLVLLMLASRADAGGYCFPSQQCLVRDTRLSLRTIRRAIKEIPRDELEIVEQAGSLKDGERKSARYRILIADPGQADPGQRDPGHNDHRTPVRESADPGQADRLTYQERTNERTKARKRARGSSSAASSRSSTQDADPPIPESLQTPAFRDAWSAFDRHRRNGKARKEWTPQAKTIALKRCTELGPARAVAAIEHSILSGWPGIYEPKPNGFSNHKPKPQERLDEFGLPKFRG